MENKELTKLFSTQISLSEWLDAIHHRDADSFRTEDKQKHERLALLKQTIGLPYDEPQSFAVAEVAQLSPKFKQFLVYHGEELCALRLIPLVPNLPKLRMRGKSVQNAVAWLSQQDVDPLKYRADFLPHDDNSTWATIFIVNTVGIFGEITRGLHSDLTQGHYERHRPNTFRFDFTTWELSRPDDGAQAHLKHLTGMIKVDEPNLRDRLGQELEAKFSHNYLEGYFETTDSSEFGIWFKDYNRILSKLYADARISPSPAGMTKAHLVAGQTGSPGKASGRVRLIDGPHSSIEPGEIMVCRMTSPDMLPLIQQAGAIVTDLGGVLSHAAIVARELGKPCLTATGNATSILRDGHYVTVDAEAGVVLAA